MPELPEVETTRQGIKQTAEGLLLSRLKVHCHQFRQVIPKDLPEILEGQTLHQCLRRGKYLLLAFDHGTLIVHLGMSGSIRRTEHNAMLLKHDHVEWLFNNHSVCLRFNDPRRFGLVVWHPNSDGPVQNHPLFAKLGIEPFDEGFTPAYLHTHLQDKSSSIKSVLLNGHIVVGVGNIYCSESLFLAGIHPQTPANKLSKPRTAKLHAAILTTLNNALNAGGSTLRDYSGVGGEAGSYFDIYAMVYDRENEACRVCQTLIKRIVQNQRASYFCSKCQKK